MKSIKHARSGIMIALLALSVGLIGGAFINEVMRGSLVKPTETKLLRMLNRDRAGPALGKVLDADAAGVATDVNGLHRETAANVFNPALGPQEVTAAAIPSLEKELVTVEPPILRAPVTAPSTPVVAGGDGRSSSTEQPEDAGEAEETGADDGSAQPTASFSRETVERCVQMADESEVCFYDGPVCYDGEKIVVFTKETAGSDARRGLNYDFRHHDVSFRGMYSWGFDRPGVPVGTNLSWIQDVLPREAPLYRATLQRTWGPQGRDAAFREEDPDVLTPQGLIDSNTSILWLRPGLLTGPEGSAGARAHWIGPETLSAEDIASGELPDQGDPTSGLYVPSFDQSWITHTYHGAAAAMVLWDVKRYNRSNGREEIEAEGGDDDEYAGDAGTTGGDPGWTNDFAGLQPGPSTPLRPMGAWAAPPMDHLIIAGEFPWKINGMDTLYNWFKGVMTILLGSHTKVVSNENWRLAGVDANHLMCARRTVVTGYKPRIFTGVADAAAWRLAAYASVNIPNKPKDDWPPRAITIVTRPTGGRSIANLDVILEQLNATGLRVNVITDAAAMSFKEQVEIMANTGIFIGAHGAGLQNSMFLPAKAVLIELFPYASAGSAWRDLVAAAGLFYYSMRSLRPPADTPSNAGLHSMEFKRKCDGWTHINDLRANGSAAALAEADSLIDARAEYDVIRMPHASSLHGYLQADCFWRTKLSSLLLRPDEFSYVLLQALDDIGCRDGWCYNHVAGDQPWEWQQEKRPPQGIHWQVPGSGRFELKV